MKHSLTCAYHRQANGMDERFNVTLVKILRNYINTNQKDWDKKLIWALTLYNTTAHESTNLSPYTVLFGVEPRTPLGLTEPMPELPDMNVDHLTIRRLAEANTKRVHAVQKYYYDKKHEAQDFEIFDLVLLRSRQVKSGN